jgi:hypothetical protein
MGRFHELDEFESRFDSMSVEELRLWKKYWARHAQQLRPKIQKQAMKRVREIEKAILQKGGEVSDDVDTLSSLNPPAETNHLPTKKAKASSGRIMYIERKAGGLTGAASIGRVTFSKTGKMLYYQGQRFQSLKGKGFKSNYYDVDSGEDYWISGPKRSGGDALYGGNARIKVDEDVREEYWFNIRRQPARIHERFA